jgi:hypothetical protein
MKKSFNSFKKIMLTACFFMFLFLGNSLYAQKKAQITVINNGKHEITFYKKEGKSAGSAMGVSANQRMNTQHTVGGVIEVHCRGKKIETFYVSGDSKKNKFEVNCN